MFRGSVKGTGYPLHLPVSPSLPLPCITMCDYILIGVYFLTDCKRMSPIISAGASVQLTTGSQGVHTSGNNAGYTTFWGSVKGTGYSLHSPVSPSLPLPCVTMCHHVSTAVQYIIITEVYILILLIFIGILLILAGIQCNIFMKAIHTMYVYVKCDEGFELASIQMFNWYRVTEYVKSQNWIDSLSKSGLSSPQPTPVH